MTEADMEAILARLKEQIVMSKGARPIMECAECPIVIPIRFTYKCLFCGLWFCQACAEVHFGKTRAAWLAENGFRTIE